MMLKRQFLIFALALSPLAAQSAADRLNRPPDGVEEALRARVSEFYNLLMDGKFRQSESLVCEDSKDRYYDSDKRKWRSMEIAKINFEGGFEKAGVVVILGSELLSRYGRMPAEFPYNAQWHFEKGNWCFYLPPPVEGSQLTPWGLMNPSRSGEPKQVVYERKPVSLEDVVKSVKITRLEMKLLSYEPSSDEIEIKNELPGILKLEIQAGELPGLKWRLSQPEARAGDTVALRVEYRPSDKAPKPPFVLTLRMEPIGQVVPIKILFDIPEEEKKKLPEGLRPN